MTLDEFKREFQTHYDMNSSGAPSINDYEMSLFLTQAVREIVEEIYMTFEQSEYIKRGLGPLITETELLTEPVRDYFDKVIVSEVRLPSNAYFILQENVLLRRQSGTVDIISEDLDNLNVTMENPFRRPSKNRALRTQSSDGKLRLYTVSELEKYKIKYMRKPRPIIVSDLKEDLDLMGDETIEGLSGPSTTELPDFLHDKIVKRAVVLAIKSFRENSLQTQIQV